MLPDPSTRLSALALEGDKKRHAKAACVYPAHLVTLIRGEKFLPAMHRGRLSVKVRHQIPLLRGARS